MSRAVKRIALFTLGRTATVHMMELKKKQEFLLPIADLLIAAYACDSAVARLNKQETPDQCAQAIVTAFCTETLEDALTTASRTLRHLYAADAPTLATALCTLGSLGRWIPLPDSLAARAAVAAAVIAAGGLPE